MTIEIKRLLWNRTTGRARVIPGGPHLTRTSTASSAVCAKGGHHRCVKLSCACVCHYTP